MSTPSQIGAEYSSSVASATEEAFKRIHRSFPEIFGHQRPHPMVILRGGLTFAIADSLEALGFDPGAQSFITSESQRTHGQPPRQQYTKFEEIQGTKTLVIGDIVASGDTIIAAARRSIVETSSIEHLIVIGFVTAEGISKIHDALRDQVQITIIALEGIFRLPPGERIRSFTSPCDFRRSEFVCTVEYLSLLANDLGLAEEQCLVYDGGERAFNPIAHTRNRSQYLRHLHTIDLDQYWDEIEFRAGVLFRDSTRVLNATGSNSELAKAQANLQRIRNTGQRLQRRA